jgi:glutamate-1-semialdehyde aminotransferase
LSTDVKLKTSEALNSSYAAIESLNKYKNALKNALDDKATDDAKDLQWRHVTDLFDLQTADLNEANQKFTIARSQIEELDNLLKQIKTNQLSKGVKNYRDAQQDLINQYRLLQAEQLKVNKTLMYRVGLHFSTQ